MRLLQHRVRGENRGEIITPAAAGAFRRLFTVLCGALAATVSVSTASAVTPNAADAARPNILVCVADDWSYPHGSIYGDKVVATPNFDRIAREGVLFTHAFCAASSCTPSRGSMLTGRPVHQLEEGGNLWSALPAKFKVYPDYLEDAGYRIGCEGKGWGPGDFKAGGRKRNPAGPNARSFEQFLGDQENGKPFCFWYGSRDPHRPYQLGSGAEAGLRGERVEVPPCWPDRPEIRSDVLDYYFAVQRFDRRLGEIFAALEKAGQLDNTLILVTGDNGMPFPRGKATCYDLGSRVPLAIRWPARLKPATVSDALVSLTAIAPTVLEAAGLNRPREMTEKSVLQVAANPPEAAADRVFVERERHANVRKGDLSYPVRGVRTSKWLYLRNLRPDRWPAGDPQMYVAVGEFGDVDPGPTKSLIISLQKDAAGREPFQLCFGKRPPEELYDIENDPHQLRNLAGVPAQATVQASLRAELDAWMRDTADPRATSEEDPWDHYQYYGKAGREMEPVKAKPQAP